MHQSKWPQKIPNLSCDSIYVFLRVSLDIVCVLLFARDKSKLSSPPPKRVAPIMFDTRKKKESGKLQVCKWSPNTATRLTHFLWFTLKFGFRCFFFFFGESNFCVRTEIDKEKKTSFSAIARMLAVPFRHIYFCISMNFYVVFKSLSLASATWRGGGEHDLSLDGWSWSYILGWFEHLFSAILLHWIEEESMFAKKVKINLKPFLTLRWRDESRRPGWFRKKSLRFVFFFCGMIVISSRSSFLSFHQLFFLSFFFCTLLSSILFNFNFDQNTESTNSNSNNSTTQLIPNGPQRPSSFSFQYFPSSSSSPTFFDCFYWMFLANGDHNDAISNRRDVKRNDERERMNKMFAKIYIKKHRATEQKCKAEEQWQ